MSLHKKCMKWIIRHLIKEGNIYAPGTCDYCVDWTARQIKDIPGWGYDT